MAGPTSKPDPTLSAPRRAAPVRARRRRRAEVAPARRRPRRLRLRPRQPRRRQPARGRRPPASRRRRRRATSATCLRAACSKRGRRSATGTRASYGQHVRSRRGSGRHPGREGRPRPPAARDRRPGRLRAVARSRAIRFTASASASRAASRCPVATGPGRDAYAEIEKALARSPRKPKGLIVNFPHNPTSAVVDLVLLREGRRRWRGASRSG